MKMKKQKKPATLFLALTALLLVLVFALSSCGPKEPPEDPEEELGETVVLVDGEDNVLFQIVVASSASREVKTFASDLAAQLKNLGVDCGKVVSDTSEEQVKKTEIVIGSDIRNRGDLSAVEGGLGKNDYRVAIVKNRIIVTGGSDEAILRGCQYLRGSVLGLNDSATKFKKKEIKRTVGKDFRQVESVTVNGNNFADYTIVYAGWISDSKELQNLRNAAFDLRDGLKDYTGLDLPVKASSEIAEGTKQFLIRPATGSLKTGCLVHTVGDDLVFEYQYAVTMGHAVKSFIDDTVANFAKDVVIDAKTSYAPIADRVFYEDYGAKGDGKTNDFTAIYNTHVAANEAGLTVCGSDDAVYYIGAVPYTVPVKTNVDWGEAHFIIDDREVTGSARNRSIFTVQSEYSSVHYGEDDLKKLNGGAPMSLSVGDTVFPMTFERDVMIIPENSNHKIYIRYGINHNEGNPTAEVLICDKDGNIDETTQVFFDYPTLTGLTVYRTDDKPLTIDGGIFTTYANNADRTYNYYSRNITISRSNVTVKNLEHYIEKEYDNGAPYNGFLNVQNCANVTMKDCIVTGHKCYRLETDNNNTMGTYDLSASYSNNITWDNVRQSNSIIDKAYWGIHGSNYCRNFTMKNCYLSRIDAHCGMVNASVTDTTLGFAFNCIGGGKLYVNNVTRLAGNGFIDLRSDYGGTWRGDVEIHNSSIYGYLLEEGNTKEIVNYNNFYLFGCYWDNHDFGYTCYMPQNLTLTNFRAGKEGKGSLILFNFGRVEAAAMGPGSVNRLQLVKSVTVSGCNNTVGSIRLTNREDALPPTEVARDGI